MNSKSNQTNDSVSMVNNEIIETRSNKTMTDNNKARKEFQPIDLEVKNDDEYENAVCKGIRECLTGLKMQILNDYGLFIDAVYDDGEFATKVCSQYFENTNYIRLEVALGNILPEKMLEYSEAANVMNARMSMPYLGVDAIKGTVTAAVGVFLTAQFDIENMYLRVNWMLWGAKMFSFLISYINASNELSADFMARFKELFKVTPEEFKEEFYIEYN